jgi:hypothetical protein
MRRALFATVVAAVLLAGVGWAVPDSARADGAFVLPNQECVLLLDGSRLTGRATVVVTPSNHTVLTCHQLIAPPELRPDRAVRDGIVCDVGGVVRTPSGRISLICVD